MNPIQPAIRRRQLVNLKDALNGLVSVLENDPECRWLPHFQNVLARAGSLLASGFTQNELTIFSYDVKSVYGGAGSFNDYAPVAFDALSNKYLVIEGMESLDTFAAAVYDCASELRVMSND